MSVDLRAAASDHLRDRRARGYVLADGDRLLGRFLDGLDERGQTRITVAAALAFATERPGATRGWQARKLRAVRGQQRAAQAARSGRARRRPRACRAPALPSRS